ncbi:AAA family ATPase [Streptomyces sp. NPDC004787]|uniref:ATP-binding protein n=1 Tax=Streptomyces sp. NPDC004787 TaxID=3154291 RepID=UPI0033BC5091
MTKVALLERDRELAVLERALGEVSSGSGALIVVSGPAGAGKTQLLLQSSRSARSHGLRELAGEGSPLEREIPFGLLRQLLDVPLARATEEERAEWLAGAAAAAEIVLGNSQRPDVEEPGEFTTLHSLYWLMVNMCSTGPLVLNLDDLHWADEPSLRFLVYLLPRLKDLPLLVVTAVREKEPGAARYLIDALLTHSASRKLPLAPLTPGAVTEYLVESFGKKPDSKFTAACYRASGGNPMLIGDLAYELKKEGIDPTEVRAEEVYKIGGRAAVRRVSRELSIMHPKSVRVAEAISVLGRDATVPLISQLTELPPSEVARGIERLEDSELLASDLLHGTNAVAHFRHPMVESAVYRQINHGRRFDYHSRASEILIDHRDIDRAAAHLLRLPPGVNSSSAVVLRKAANQAISRNAPESALAYLRHLLSQSLPADERLELLTQAATVASGINLPYAAILLREALEAVNGDIEARARIAGQLGTILLYLSQPEAAVDVLNEAIGQLGPGHQNERRALEAALLNIGTITPGWKHLLTRADALKRLPPATTMEASMLDCILAGYETFRGDPSGLELARRALARPDVRAAAAKGVFAFPLGCWALVVGDPDEGVEIFSTVMDEARRSGTLAALFLCHLYRSLGSLNRGDLLDAEIDLREAGRLQDVTGWTHGRPTVSALMAETMLELGRPTEAASALSDAQVSRSVPRGFLHYYLYAKSRLLYAQEHYDAALTVILETGDRLTEAQSFNPAVIPWRSQAALCLQALGRADEALPYCREELRLARRWGAPYAVGRATRITGQVSPGTSGVNLLKESVEILRTSSARLEYAKSLLVLGAALQSEGKQGEARQCLTAALSIAQTLQAAPIAESARRELHSAGFAASGTVPAGTAERLTSTELTISRLAAQGLTNRQIAERLYLAQKTVEGRLSAIYRKIGISRREQLRFYL